MNPIFESMKLFYESNIVNYFNTLVEYPIKIVALLIDLTIVGYLLFVLIKKLKGTKAILLIKGIAALLILTAVSQFFSLNILHYILSSFTTYGVTLIIVIFQPELRKALEQVGGSTDIRKFFDFEQIEKTSIDEIVKAVYKMSGERVGALIVFERSMKLNDIISTGVTIDSEVSSELIQNIFVPDTPLHDGAMVIRNGRILAASCILPITKREDLDREFGTRHRAAIGLSEECDAIIVVVSEETGRISLVIDGKIIRGLTEESLGSELKRRLERKNQIKIKNKIEQFKEYSKK